MISEETLLGFNWPKSMKSFSFAKKKVYLHEVIIVGKHDPEVGIVIRFPSEKKARRAVSVNKESSNVLDVWYERKEFSSESEEGFQL